MKFHKRFAVSLFVIAAPCLARAELVTATSGSVQFSVSAAIQNGGSDSSSNGASWSTNPTTLFTQSFANAMSPQGGLLNAFGGVFASWTSNESGDFQGQSVGWQWGLQPGDGVGSTAITSGAPDWTYAFTANANAKFNLNYSVTSNFAVFGLQGWDLYVNGVDVLPLQNAILPDVAGTFSYSLVGGHAYTMALINGGNLGSSTTSPFEGLMDSDFQWSIDPATVPEPEGWALMILGAAMSGAGLRRSRVARHAR